MPTVVKSIEVVYTCGLHMEDDEEIFVFSPNVRFFAKKQPDVSLSTDAWNRMGKPRQIKVTIEPV